MKIFIILIIAVAAFASVIADESRGVNYQDFMQHPELFADDLEKDGVWVNWSTAKGGYPKNAVFAGFDENGASYVIRADHTSAKGTKKILGKYFPSRNKAFVGVSAVEYEKAIFQILTHDKYTWADKNSPCKVISGSNGDSIFRLKAEGGDNMTPGRADKDGRFCTITYHGSEVMSPEYQILKRKC